MQEEAGRTSRVAQIRCAIDEQDADLIVDANHLIEPVVRGQVVG